MMTRPNTVIAASLMFAFLLPQAAIATDTENASVAEAEAGSDASGFLSRMDGKFRGRGEAKFGLSKEPQRISCRVSNEFNADTEILNVEGSCATTQGKVTVTGELKIVDGKVEGSFIAPIANSEMTGSRSAFGDDTLTITNSFVDKNSGALTRIQQVVTVEEEDGFLSRFLQFENASGEFKESGWVKFVPEKDE